MQLAVRVNNVGFEEQCKQVEPQYYIE